MEKKVTELENKNVQLKNQNDNLQEEINKIKAENESIERQQPEDNHDGIDAGSYDAKPDEEKDGMYFNMFTKNKQRH